MPCWDTYIGAQQIEHRDYQATTPHRSPFLTFYHPEMQEVLLNAASAAGAEVRRGVVVRHVRPGATPIVTVEQNGNMIEISARLVVGADGRASMVRKWGGFAAQHDPARLLFAGVLFENVPAPNDALYLAMNPSVGRATFLGNLGHGRVRAYLAYRKDANLRIQGADSVRRFIEEVVHVGLPAEFFSDATAIGPLAVFEGANVWVDRPYRQGIALIGDAAATNDPSWGQGLSCTVRDVRVLRDQLLSDENWDIAGFAYAEEHDRYYKVIHTLENWLADLFMEVGPVAEALRAKALPLIAQDATRMPDLFGLGPEQTVNETTRMRLFGD
jgi:2-polyprenyl-6-methoxyphenol hydroxylase-like FAD-dependent oxidoreductase